MAMNSQKPRICLDFAWSESCAQIPQSQAKHICSRRGARRLQLHPKARSPSRPAKTPSATQRGQSSSPSQAKHAESSEL